jgi:hypothetical protein
MSSENIKQKKDTLRHVSETHLRSKINSIVHVTPKINNLKNNNRKNYDTPLYSAIPEEATFNQYASHKKTLTSAHDVY